MKKTYLVTVDIDKDAMASAGHTDFDAGAIQAMTVSLEDNRFLGSPVVRLAPNSFQPNNNDKPRLGEIVVDNHTDAQELANGMRDILKRHKSVSVADLKMLADLLVTHVDYKYGWTDLREMEIRSDREGYVLFLPDPKLLNDNEGSTKA